jgi:hypothetical protein
MYLQKVISKKTLRLRQCCNISSIRTCVYIFGGKKIGINRSILISCLVGKYSFPALKGHHHERSLK